MKYSNDELLEKLATIKIQLEAAEMKIELLEDITTRVSSELTRFGVELGSKVQVILTR